jgi:uncharacterized damage-inducible protein DinB
VIEQGEDRQMKDLSETIAAGLEGYYRHVGAELHKWVDPLSEEEFWRKPLSPGNSVGHLVLHLTGNLNYYIGARVAKTGYVRDREREFTETQHRPKSEVLEAFDRAIDMVVDTIRKQSTASWIESYEGKGEPDARDRFTVLLRCAGHAYHHVGQIIYLNREVVGTIGAKNRLA